MTLILAAIIAYMIIRSFSLHGCLGCIMQLLSWIVVVGIILIILWLA